MRVLAGFAGVGLLCMACSGSVSDGGPSGGGSSGTGTGGRGNTAGSAGLGATPTTSNVFVDQIVQTAVDKVDLLFMIDNSVSMADKQKVLEAALPVLLQRLASPSCVDASGNPTGSTISADGSCAAP